MNDFSLSISNLVNKNAITSNLRKQLSKYVWRSAVNDNFFKLFFVRFLTDFWIIRKKKEIGLTWYSDSWFIFRIIVQIIWSTVIGFGVRIIFFFWCLRCERLRCLILKSNFFSKIQKFSSFYEVYIRNPKLIWSLLVIRFSKIFYSTQWAYFLLYYHK